MSIDLLKVQFRFNHYVANANAEGVTQAESLEQLGHGGNCMNWVLGHVVVARQAILQILGQERQWDEERGKRYVRGTDALTNAAEALPFEEILETYNASQENILSGLDSFDVGRLDDPAPFSPTNNENETLGSLLAGLSFHEAYHLGQTGVLRRGIGKAGAIR